MNDMPTGKRSWRRSGVVLGVLLIGALGAGCSLGDLTNSDALPKNLSDPELTQTPSGARRAYAGTLAGFASGFDDAVVNGAVLTDELQPAPNLDSKLDISVRDVRILPEGESFHAAETGQAYSAFHKVRGEVNQAVGLLYSYLPESTALVAHLYAIKGYTEIFLAELYCSGIPLSTLDYNGDFTYQPGSSTEEVFADAVALFDSTLALAGDSTRFVNLARVGLGRALLGRGEYAAAAAAVADVPDQFVYNVGYSSDTVLSAWNFAKLGTTVSASDVNGWSYTVADNAGGNGLDWGTSGDPRTAVTQMTGTFGSHFYHPDKYATDGSTPIVLASGVEARLIEAEAALQAGDAGTWLAKLNLLRETAITPALPDTTDPNTADARIDLLFRERAFWLFLTGHRQGDLRRLVGQYHRDQNAVYPSGSYPPNNGGFSFYGSDITLPIPSTESANPLYTGCASRGA